MTEDQAVAWLILEGYSVGVNRVELRWVTEVDEIPPTRWRHGGISFGSVEWSAAEFDGEDGYNLVSAADYPQYAPAVVKLLMEKENEP